MASRGMQIGVGLGTRLVRRMWIVFLVGLLTLIVSLANAAQDPSETSVKPQDAQGRPIRDFAPGIRILWVQGTVELDAEVALREGPLELLACSPRSREHESILVVAARPVHIFQAMGLVGLEPGSPVEFDEKSDRWKPASGELLTLEVRCNEWKDEKLESVESWFADAATGQVVQKLDWVFCGSRVISKDRFAADGDGTVACVVDFDSALIGLKSSHSADNEQLWLKANTEAIPPKGTKCTLSIRSAERHVLLLTVADDGTLRRQGERVRTEEIAASARAELAGGRAVSVVIRPDAGVPKSRVDEIIEALSREGVNREQVRIQEGKPTQVMP